jgi:hypothetical protein
MSGMMTKWSIAHDRTVSDGDLGRDGYLTEGTLSRWIDAAIAAYLDQCVRVRQAAFERGLVINQRLSRRPRPSLLGQPDEVLVTASATEVRPEEFVISVRLRPMGSGDDMPVNVTCRVSLEHPATGEPAELGTPIRDELIALEHGAQYFS